MKQWLKLEPLEQSTQPSLSEKVYTILNQITYNEEECFKILTNFAIDFKVFDIDKLVEWFNNNKKK